MIGPTEAVPVRPNEPSSPVDEVELRRTVATPKPKAIMKGTVIGPVVAPPESNAIPKKLVGAKNASAKSTTYAMAKVIFMENLKTVRKSPMRKNYPTPAAITKVSKNLSTNLKIERT